MLASPTRASGPYAGLARILGLREGTQIAIVALVGRPNVGKSALFNRITQSHRAIVENTPGVTRDRLYERTDWNGREFTVVDTGGIWADTGDSILGMTRKQTELAIHEADVIVFVVDGQEGPTSADDTVAELLRRTQKPVLLAVNKTESHKVAQYAALPYYEYGLGEPTLISSLHGEGIGDLLDAVVDRLPAVPASEAEREATRIRVAIAGRPNVGKSSLVNMLIGSERSLVTPIAGTTRDVVDTPIDNDYGSFLLLDTAGLRRPNRIQEGLEEKTVHRSLEAIRTADVVIMMAEASRSVSGQDQRIAGLVERSGKASVVLLNKADVVKGSTVPKMQEVREAFKFMPWAAMMAVSVKTGWHTEQIWEAVREAYTSYTLRIPTHLLNQIIQEAIHLNPPPTEKGQALKIYYATQVGVRPPEVVLFCNDPDLVHFHYPRYLERRLRERFGFAGTPLRISFRPRHRSSP